MVAKVLLNSYFIAIWRNFSDLVKELFLSVDVSLNLKDEKWKKLVLL